MVFSPAEAKRSAANAPAGPPPSTATVFIAAYPLVSYRARTAREASRRLEDCRPLRRREDSRPSPLRRRGDSRLRAGREPPISRSFAPASTASPCPLLQLWE